VLEAFDLRRDRAFAKVEKEIELGGNQLAGLENISKSKFKESKATSMRQIGRSPNHLKLDQQD